MRQRRGAPRRKALKRTPLRRSGRRQGTGGSATRVGKYGVAPADARQYRGIQYDSLLETKYAQQLDLLRHALRADERVINVERQVSVKLEVNGNLICRHIVDFRVTYADGRVVYDECKGYPTDTWRIKHALFRALFHDRTYRVIRKV